MLPNSFGYKTGSVVMTEPVLYARAFRVPGAAARSSLKKSHWLFFRDASNPSRSFGSNMI